MTNSAPDYPSTAPPRSETKHFGRSAALYLGSGVLTRALSLILTPVYTRLMDPADFAVVAVANAVTSVLGICFGLALHGSIPRLFFEYERRQQRAFFGTLLTISLLVPLAFTAVLYPLGMLGYLDFFRNVRFLPHIRLILWTSVCTVFLPLPTMVYVAREQPERVAALNVFAALSQIAFTIVFVVGLRQGAVGVLRANLAGAALVGAFSVLLMARLSSFSLAMPGARAALAYSLPLVPHLIGNWALSISDRLILDKYVPAADVGRYSLGYIFGLILGVIASSIGQALTPIANRHLKDDRLAKSLPPLGTYAMLGIIVAALGLALTAPEVLVIIAPRSYGGASDIVPWVVLGTAFQGIYLIWSIGTWFSMKTSLVPIITLLGAGLNIVANLIFVPKHGIIAAAIATAASYALAAALHGALAQRLHPVAWEYRRWIFMTIVAGVWYTLGLVIPARGLVALFLAKSAITLVAFPASLVLLRFFSEAELNRIRSVFRREISA